MKRDKNGRFLKGNPGGPGRSRRKTEDDYIKLLADVCTASEWEKICKKAVSDAVKGDYRARQWVSDYIVGKPKQVLTLESSETMMLAQVLKHFEQIGLSPSDVFTAMLASNVAMIESEVIGNE